MEIAKANKCALLFGATGLIGGHVLNLLLKNDVYSKVIAFTRKPLAIEHEKLINPVINFDHLSNHKSLINGDDLFICLGTTMRKAGSKEAFRKVDFSYPMEICTIAQTNGVNQVLLVSSIGADPDSSFFYSRVKGELELAIQKLAFWSIHIFRPSLLIGERNENRWGENIAGWIGKGLDKITGGLLTKYLPIEGEAVAAAMIRAANQLKNGNHVYPSDHLQLLAEAYYKEEKLYI